MPLTETARIKLQMAENSPEMREQFKDDPAYQEMQEQADQFKAMMQAAGLLPSSEPKSTDE